MVVTPTQISLHKHLKQKWDEILQIKMGYTIHPQYTYNGGKASHNFVHLK